MAALSAGTTRRIIGGGYPYQKDYAVKASTTIFRGGAVGSSSGYARALNAADDFLGFAQDDVDNSAGSNGDKRVRCWVKGELQQVAITGGTGVGDIGSAVYMSSDNDLTLTSTSNTLIGKVCAYDSVSGKFDVSFCAKPFLDP